MDDSKKAFSGILARPGDLGDSPGQVVIPQELPVLTLRNTVLYPGSIVPLGIGRPKTVRLVEESIRDNGLVAVVAQRDPDCDDPGPSDLYEVGCAASLVKLVKTGKDNFSVVVRGLARVKIQDYSQSLPYLKARVAAIDEPNLNPVEVEALALSLKKSAREVLKLIPELPPSAAELLEKVEDPSVLADLIASNVEASIEEKESVLETAELSARMRKVLELLTRQLEVLKLSNKISSQVKGEMSKTQREYYLRQQLKAIKEELGDNDESDDDLADLERRIQNARMSEEAEKQARKELKRLRNMSSSQAEYTVARTYLEWLCDLPWSSETEDKLVLAEVRRILDEDHYGLEKVKKRIVEYLAVRKLKSDMKGPILCLVGPPGVGKTSLGQSIAKSMGRKFVRVAMGGVRDEAEIRGHRRTYVGALPGRIIQGMKKSQSKNPVFVLDEVDKLASDFRGDPAAALLEVLDPEQNHTFGDHYLDVPFDLSKAFFIATANQLDPIPAPLRDRMEIIEIPGYTREEKIAIARTHMLPKQLENHGIKPEQFTITDGGLERLVAGYTREAGVRNLNREVQAVCRAIAVEIADGKPGPFVVDEKKIEEILGPEKFMNEMAERTEMPGVATGLAWTAVGGDILFIEANRMRGKGSLSLTGQLGDVMKESAQAAMSYVRASAARLGVDDAVFAGSDIHLHVPAGGIPKDGPSAGVTMLTALVSLLTGIRVRNDVAMTGEITLRGNVLPVGGIKEKVLAAKRAGVTKIILPERNRKDLADIPAKNLEGLDFTFAHRMDEVLAAALEKAPTPLPDKGDGKEAKEAPAVN